MFSGKFLTALSNDVDLSVISRYVPYELFCNCESDRSSATALYSSPQDGVPLCSATSGAIRSQYSQSSFCSIS
eukprot:m.271754 g.271754  ORF g.271754 m.271754 type:complete len:73 (+) comp19746_c0_seq34:266-484(+)